jgi:proliferating cell nuclear antigen
MSSSSTIEELHFLAVTQNADVWKSISSSIMSIVDEAYFEANPKGLTFRSMDPSHVALIDITWPTSAFERYECPSTLKFGLKISDFAKILKRAGPNDSIEISIKGSSLSIKTTGGYVRNYKVNVLASGDQNASPLPKLNFDSKIVIDTIVLDNIFSDVGVLSNNITIETSIDEKMVAKFSGNSDSGSVALTLDGKKSNIETIQDITVKENSKSAYNMDYISKIVKTLSSVCNNVIIEYSSKKPLKLEFVFPNSLTVQLFLAPRIEN